MLETASGWRLDVQEEGGWLFVRIVGPSRDTSDMCDLARRAWSIIREHQVYRVVLELDEIRMLGSMLLGQFIRLEQQLAVHDGVLRLSGLSRRNQEVLDLFGAHLGQRLATYATREQAVRGG
jgi:anti-anti-sigma regulatory factor